MPSLFQVPGAFTVDATGAPYPGMQVYFYSAGTTIAQPVYQDILKSTPHAFPVVADANGILPAIYLDDSLPTNYRVVFRDADGALIPGMDYDNVPKGASGGGGGTGGGNAPSLLRVQSTAQAFTFDAGGAASPGGQTIQFTATLQNLLGTVTWTTTPVVPLSVSGNQATMSVVDFAANTSVKVTATLGAGLSAVLDEVTVYRLQSGGVNSVVAFLTNENHTVAADSTGVVSTFAGADGQFVVFSGLTDVTVSSTLSVIAQSGCTVTVNTAANTPVSGQSKGYYRVTALTADQGYADLQAVYSGVTIVKRLTLSKARQGVQGTPGTPGAPGSGTAGPRGPGEFQVAALESGAGYAISAADVLAWNGGTVTTGIAQEAAAAVIAKASDGKLQTSDRLLMYDSVNGQAATRFYTGGTTSDYLTVTAGQWSAKVTQTLDGSLLVNGSVAAQSLAVAQLGAISADLGTVDAGTIEFASGGFTRRISRTPFGSANQFIEWFGPTVAVGAMTEANAITYLKVDGSAYFGGTLSAGILKNGAQSTSIAGPTLDLLAGPSSSNGGTITVVWSYRYNGFYQIPIGGGSGGYTTTPPTATVELWRAVNTGTGPGTMVQSQVITGTNFIDPANIVDPGTFQEDMLGSFTFVDTLNLAQSRLYTLRLAARSVQGAATPMSGGFGRQQFMTILATE